MTHSNHPKHPNAHTDPIDVKDGSGQPYWVRAHRDWKFWIAVLLMLTCMGVYIVTLDLSVHPPDQNGQQIQQTTP